jgi:hypothetical protein
MVQLSLLGLHGDRLVIVGVRLPILALLNVDVAAMEEVLRIASLVAPDRFIEVVERSS